MTLRCSLRAVSQLSEIWRWNADKYGAAHATEFVDFLEKRTGDLRLTSATGRRVPNRTSYCYKVIRKRSRGHGYVVVYEVLETEVHVLCYFHTAQDWLKQLLPLLPKE